MADPSAFNAGVSASDDIDPKETADCKRLHKEIREARDFDLNARKNYVRDRLYARGAKGGFEVRVPICATWLDLKCGFLYARNPDLDIKPADATDPPPMAEIIRMAREDIGQMPSTHMQMEQIGMQAAQAAAHAAQQAQLGAPQTAVGDATASKNVAPPPIPPEIAGEQAAQAWLDATIKQKADEIMKPYRDRQSQAKQIGKTLQLVIENAWKKAILKKVMNKTIRSEETLGPGWLKLAWHEDAQNDPIAPHTDRDEDDSLQRLNQLLEDQEDALDAEEKQAEIDDLKQGIEANAEVKVMRYLAADFVRAEDIQVSTAIASLEDYLDAPWISHRVYKTKDDAKAEFPDIADKIDGAKVYIARKPADQYTLQDIGSIATVDASEADAYTSNDSPGNNKTGSAPEMVCIEEAWDKSAGVIKTLIHGLDDRYARPVMTPNPPTSRFYPFFLIAMNWVDGERHPQSTIFRSRDLFDDVMKSYSNRTEYRRRSIPKTAFDSRNLDEEQALKVSSATAQEMVGLAPTNPDSKINDLFAPITYAAYNPQLYDDRPAMQKLEMIWGISEMLASATQTVEKTATEAEIQQTGTNSRTSYERAVIDDVMSEIANHTAEIVLQKITHDEVVQICGPWAQWPQGITLEQIGLLVAVAVRAGTSGKPDTAAQQQAWASTLPLLQKSVIQIGQLRGSSPQDIADCLEELMSETLNRTGEHLDVSRFMPQAPSTEPGKMPSAPGQVPAPIAAQAGHTPRPVPIGPPAPHPGELPVPHHGHIQMPGGTLQ